jgi:hypothetical protein
MRDAIRCREKVSARVVQHVVELVDQPALTRRRSTLRIGAVHDALEFRRRVRSARIDIGDDSSRVRASNIVVGCACDDEESMRRDGRSSIRKRRRGTAESIVFCSNDASSAPGSKKYFAGVYPRLGQRNRAAGGDSTALCRFENK